MKDGKQGEGNRGKRERATSWAAVAAATPGCILALLSAIALVLAAFGRHPMWPHEELTLAEAAGVREEAEVVRLIERGQDPNARYPVRAGLLFERAVSLTPLEAAVVNGDPFIADQLLTGGAVLTASSWVALRCFATDSRVGPLLDAHRPAGVTLDCSGITVPWD